MKKNIIIILILIVFSLFMMGNAPAAYWACDGKYEGDTCTPYGYGCSSSDGVCGLIENCEDDPSTEVNECLMCR